MYCENDENDRDIYFIAIYQPFDDEPTTEGYICDYCSDDIVWCDSCDREIYESNGYRKNVRYNYNNGHMECVRCLQERWFVEGMKSFKYIYGPVHSWRLGSSLGIDPLSQKDKICSFDCNYCQLGRARVYTCERKTYIPEEKITEEIFNVI